MEKSLVGDFIIILWRNVVSDGTQGKSSKNIDINLINEIM